MFFRGLFLLLLGTSFLFSQNIDVNNPLVQEYIKKNGIDKFDKEENLKLPNNLSKKEMNDNIKELEDSKLVDENDSNKTNKVNNELTEELKELKEEINPFFYNSKDEVISKISKKKNKKDETSKIEKYGLNFFTQTSNEPLAYITPPDNYILSKGDTLKISIYGSQNNSYEVAVDKEGSINIPKIGKLNLENKEYSEAKKYLINKLNSFYPNSEAFISIVDLKTITITVVGEAKNPGQYNLPALSKVKDALIYASGVSQIGSLRNIKVLRNDKVISNFDLYSLLKNGKSKGDLVLRSGDVVFVPIAKKSIKVLNGVKNPAIYELKNNENLQKVIAYSGGLLSDSIKTVKLKRNENGKKVFLDVEIEKDIALKDGDEISILPSSNFYKNRVTLLGNVYRDESYEIKTGETLKSLFEKIINTYGKENIFMPQTDMNYVVVKRIDENTLENKTYSRNLSKILNGDKNEDLNLKSEDKIFIFNKDLTQNIKYVLVEGEVETEGKLKFFNGMKLIDALNATGLKKESDTKSIRVISYDENMNQKVNFYSIDEAYNVKLRKYDEIKISNYFETNDFPTVTIKGAVNEPGVFQYNDGMRIKDLINYAKGLKNSARLDSFELISYKTVNSRRLPELNKYNLREVIEKNISLNAYDEVIVQEINGWNERSTVTLKGEVLFPGEYIITPGEKISNVIKRAGGYTKEAFIKGALFTREDVKEIQKDALKKQLKELENSIVYYSTKGSQAGESEDKTMLLRYMEKIKAQAENIEVVGRVAINLERDLEKLKESDYDIVLKDGDTLTIPTYEDSVMVIGEVMTQNALTWKDGEDVVDYIDRVGGMKESANKKGIFVIKANGEAKKVGYSSVFGLSSVDVEKGDVIVVPFDLSQFSNIKYAKDLTSVLYQIAVSAASLKTVGAL